MQVTATDIFNNLKVAHDTDKVHTIMATILEKSRIFRVMITRRCNEKLVTEWNGRDSFELAGETQKYIYMPYYEVCIKEFDKSPVIRALNSKNRVLFGICQQHPELSFDPGTVKIDISGDIGLSELESYEIDESEFTPEQIEALGRTQNGYNVVVAVGIRGQYVTGTVNWYVDHSLSELEKSSRIDCEVAMQLIQDYLVDNNLIDERYYL